MKDVEAFYLSLEASGTPKRYTHKIGDYEVNGINNLIVSNTSLLKAMELWISIAILQFVYIDWVAAACGLPRLEEWRKKMYHAVFVNKKVRPEAYRDEWDDEDLVLEAQKDFLK